MRFSERQAWVYSQVKAGLPGKPRFCLWVRLDEAAFVGALAGQNLVIEILLPVDIGRAVLQLLNGAAQLGMTREQARQIEASALRRPRRPSGPCAKRVIDSFAEVRDSDEGIRRDG